MGLWLKQADGLVSVSNGGGAYDGEHVLSGNPLDPPAALQVGQLLYDGNPSTGGSGAGIEEAPNDGLQYARQNESWSTVEIVDAGIEEAPVDGLQYARKDEGWVEVGDISSFDGEHVPTGDPTDPATLDLVDEGQLLFDGVEGGESGDAGPHSHTEYAPAEHDHDDYLPLAGGTLTGDLTVEDRLTLGSETSNPLMLVNSGETRVGYFGVPGAQAGIDGELHLRSDKALILQGIDGVRVLQSDLTVGGSASVGHGKTLTFNGNWEGCRIYNTGSGTREYMVLGNFNTGAQINLYGMGDDTGAGNILFYAGEEEGGGSRTVGRWDGPTGGFIAYRDAEVRGDLQVDGNADITINVPSDYWRGRKAGTIFHEYGGIVSQGSFSTALNSNGYRNGAGTWTNLGHGSGATVVELFPTGGMHVRVASDYPTGSPAHLPSRFVVNESGPTFRAMPSKTRTVDDILERAETAEFPPEDDEGVVTVDGHDEVPLFEVVSALLAKVKELSTRIEELEGN